jgi:hypothetical protein
VGAETGVSARFAGEGVGLASSPVVAAVAVAEASTLLVAVALAARPGVRVGVAVGDGRVDVALRCVAVGSGVCSSRIATSTAGRLRWPLAVGCKSRVMRSIASGLGGGSSGTLSHGE